MRRAASKPKIPRVSVGTAASDLRRPGAPAPVPRARALLADPALLAVATLTALGSVLRFYRIGHQGLWFDEGNTALLVHFSPSKMLGLIPQRESTPPLYYELYPEVVDAREEEGGVPSRLTKTDRREAGKEGTPWWMFAGSRLGRTRGSRHAR
jgi:hypothetical protein